MTALVWSEVVIWAAGGTVLGWLLAWWIDEWALRRYRRKERR